MSLRISAATTAAANTTVLQALLLPLQVRSKQQMLTQHIQTMLVRLAEYTHNLHANPILLTIIV
jgi:hypothetical protein